ncbi:unnamed protein product [marine sediment metagenome]|uniref:Uncharacterized protein n=1 Tax=marine sediment metagenome TaxID=412755 RepID=X1EUG0_9ZZZZ
MAEQPSALTLIKRFFEKGEHGRKVTLDELKALSKEDREELVELVKKES